MTGRHKWFNTLIAVILLVLWAGFAAWQWREFGHEHAQAEESLDRQGRTAHHLLVSSIVSHRGMGPLFDSMIQDSLRAIVEPRESQSPRGAIRSVGIAAAETNNEEGVELLLAEGDVAELTASPDDRKLTCYRWVGVFTLSPDFGTRGGGGTGGGLGRGFGRLDFGETNQSKFQPGRSYQTIFLLDRTDVDRRLHGAMWLRGWLVASGGLMLLLLVVAWRATMRLVEAQGRQRVLESEAEHLREMGQAAAGLAHETRNPLGLVRGWTQRLAQSEAGSPQQREQSEAVIEECDRVTARINQFLSFAKPCAPQCEPVNLIDLAQELEILLEPDLETREVRIELSPQNIAATASVDREMFRQALFNLVSNAITFAPSGGVIEINIATGNDGRTRIEVADRGPGVSSEHVDSLFSPYFTTRHGGTGLGLAIVRRIARSHGWQVGYRPRADGGSIFWMDESNGL